MTERAFCVAILVGLLCASCASPAASRRPDTPEPRPASAERAIRGAVESMFAAGWNRGEVEVFDDTIADSVVFHYAGSPRTMTREQMSQIVLRWREAFPDLEMTVDELLVQGNLAAARLTFSGTHRGEWAGAAPTSERVTMALQMFFRFEDGQMVELWESDDQLGFRKQLGLLPSREARTPPRVGSSSVVGSSAGDGV